MRNLPYIFKVHERRCPVKRTPKTPLRLRRAWPTAPAAAGLHSCLDCPDCGTEKCRMQQELGMYCDTLMAASEATQAGGPAKVKPAVARVFPA